MLLLLYLEKNRFLLINYIIIVQRNFSCRKLSGDEVDILNTDSSTLNDYLCKVF